MKKIFYTLLSGVLMATGVAKAQCPAGRYNTELFPTYTVSTVTYSSVYNLEMDIYQPTGDTYANRPVIILGHGGAFIDGNKTADGTVVELCKRFAKRGYVTASINYRLGDLLSMSFDSMNAVATVVKAISDGKAAVRYFMQDAATSNTYRVDTNNIFVGGNSAGAVLYMHATYLDNMSEVPTYIADVMTANGGFEGNSGNPGYNVKIRGAINLAGALARPWFVGPGNKPSVNAQGTEDGTVPYDCAYPLSGVVKVNLCGLGQLEPMYAANGIYHMSKIYVGSDHVPWGSNAAMLNSVDSMIEEFCYNLTCGTTGVKEVSAPSDVQLYPNPASGVVTISADEAIATVSVCDQTGRVVYTTNAVNGNSHSINTAKLAPGMYVVRASFKKEDMAPVVKRLVIE